MQFYSILDLGGNREVLANGFTVFRNVSIARTGWQDYAAGELPGIDPGPDGLVHIYRDPKEVFRPETLASCNGMALVITHPEDDVTPDNWRELANGFMSDARRGSGAQSDECVADIFVATRDALEQIDGGVREVSLGYGCDYLWLAPGKAAQTNIVVNHVALVERGRCGPQCAIRDHALVSNRVQCPIGAKRFMDASAARWGQGPRLSADELRRMNPMQRFVAASKARWK